MLDRTGTFSAAIANVSCQKSVDENVRNSFQATGRRQQVFWQVQRTKRHLCRFNTRLSVWDPLWTRLVLVGELCAEPRAVRVVHWCSVSFWRDQNLGFTSTLRSFCQVEVLLSVCLPVCLPTKVKPWWILDFRYSRNVVFLVLPVH